MPILKYYVPLVIRKKDWKEESITVKPLNIDKNKRKY